MEIARPYLVFLGAAPDELAIKTAQGVADWRPDWCLGEVRLAGCKASTGLPEMTVAQGAENGAKTLVIGVVNPGGVIPPEWVASLIEAMEAGLDVASGLHSRLGDVAEIAEAAARTGRRLIDFRHSNVALATGKGAKRAGRRLLTVGTDCSIGKKYTALALEKEMRAQGMNADFVATGQTGVLISNRGLAIDAVIADFISGAAEWLTPEAASDHWDVVEGQGSLFHPSFAGVSLGLLHGAQPDAIVMCHEPTRTTMRNVATAMPDLRQCIDMNIALARLTNPAVQCVGISVNTSALGEAAAADYLAGLARDFGLPCVDSRRGGVAPIVARLRAVVA